MARTAFEADAPTLMFSAGSLEFISCDLTLRMRGKMGTGQQAAANVREHVAPRAQAQAQVLAIVSAVASVEALVRRRM